MTVMMMEIIHDNDGDDNEHDEDQNAHNSTIF